MIFERTQMLIGKKNMDMLRSAHIAVFGIGGVGASVAFALCRSGVGNIDIIDGDLISESNINRQIIAFTSTIGKKKTEVAEKMLKDINPQAKVNAIFDFYSAETAEKYDFSKYSYIIDAIDTVTSKLLIIENAFKAQIPVISCMGTGNKLHPEFLQITDISKTSVCPLARVMRRELKAKGIKNIKVLWSKEQPIKPQPSSEKSGKRQIPGSMSFVPPAAGYLIAGEVVRNIIEEKSHLSVPTKNSAIVPGPE